MPLEDEEAIRRILKSAKTIAVVGASDKPWRDSYSIMAFLLQKGYEVFPVNPLLKKVLDRPCYPDLAALPKKVDIVDVFRRSEAVPAIVDEAIAAKAKVLWLQFGVVHREAAKKAEDRGLAVVMDHCIAIDHRRLIP